MHIFSVFLHNIFVYPSRATPRGRPLSEPRKIHSFLLCYWEMTETYVAAVARLICTALPPNSPRSILPLKNDKQTGAKEKRDG